MAIPHANDTQSPACTRKQAYTFEGVDCPVCAAKIEDRIQKIDPQTGEVRKAERIGPNGLAPMPLRQERDVF